MIEWGVLIGQFLLCICSNPTGDWHSEKAVNGGISKFQLPRWLISTENRAEIRILIVVCQLTICVTNPVLELGL